MTRSDNSGFVQSGELETSSTRPLPSMSTISATAQHTMTWRAIHDWNTRKDTIEKNVSFQNSAIQKTSDRCTRPT